MIEQEITSMTGILLGRGPLHIPCGTPTLFLAEEYRDNPKKREKKVYVKPEHNMVLTERLNRAKVLAEIKKKPGNSSELLQRTGLSRTAIHNLARALIEEGKVRLNKEIWPWIYEAKDVPN